MRLISAIILLMFLSACKTSPVVPDTVERVVKLNIASPPPLSLDSYKERLQYILIKDGETYYVRTSLDSFNATMELLRTLGYRIQVLEVTLDQYRKFYEPEEVK